ncbi:hypothetical protein DVQ51_09575 [Yersinia enterocolitica]|nr:hypothetical protein [Yersinia enterocolitica]EKN6155462.1 hypothetical protein [Yersinia enterocolitica]EKN6173849.1 hypothetical protein [Yersinia enterocolitica]EKN6359977.1 hypothetical protein [Yersinia enterocolitica]CCQ41552.1 hypothetical protein YE5303_35041 [Yersinia enterocolitica (type O:5) str. YE53/03]
MSLMSLQFRMEKSHSQLFRSTVSMTQRAIRIQHVSVGLCAKNKIQILTKYMSIDIHVFNIIIDSSNENLMLNAINSKFSIVTILGSKTTYWIR